MGTTHCRQGCIADHRLGDEHCAPVPAAVPLLHPVPGHDAYLLVGAIHDGDTVLVELDLGGSCGRVQLDDLVAVLVSVGAEAWS